MIRHRKIGSYWIRPRLVVESNWFKRRCYKLVRILYYHLAFYLYKYLRKYYKIKFYNFKHSGNTKSTFLNFCVTYSTSVHVLCCGSSSQIGSRTSRSDSNIAVVIWLDKKKKQVFRILFCFTFVSCFYYCKNVHTYTNFCTYLSVCVNIFYFISVLDGLRACVINDALFKIWNKKLYMYIQIHIWVRLECNNKIIIQKEKNKN